MKGPTAHSSRTAANVRRPRSPIVRLASALCVRLAAATAGLIAMPITPACAAEIPWKSSYAEALTESVRDGKPVLIQVTADWCGYCHKMFGETYVDKQVTKQVNRGFVALKLDADADPELVEQLKVEALPTTVIVTPDRKVLRRLTGYQTPHQLTAALAAADRQIAAGMAEKTAALDAGAPPAPARAEKPIAALVADNSR